MDISKRKLVILKILALVTVIELLGVALFGMVYISQFETLLNDLAEPIPITTRAYLVTYKFWILLEIFPIFIMQGLRSEVTSKLSFGVSAFLLVGHMILGFLIVVAAVFAMYQPVLEFNS